MLAETTDNHEAEPDLQPKVPPPPPSDAPLFSNKVQRIILLAIDLLGLAAFLAYCYFVQSYFSAFYFLMMLVMIQFTWENSISHVGMYDPHDPTKKKLLSPSQFFLYYTQLSLNQQSKSNEDNETPAQVLEDESEEINDESEIVYKPLYWLQYRDVKKYIWLIILLVSFLCLIEKGTFLVLLNQRSDETVSLMTQAGYESIEIYFYTSPYPSQAAQTCANQEYYCITPKEYVKMFLPNSLIFLFSLFALTLRRVHNKRFLEEFSKRVKPAIFYLYFAIAWIFLSVVLSTSIAMVGYTFLIIQMMFVLRLYFPSLGLDMFVIQFAKLILYILLPIIYLASTPVFLSSLETYENAFLSSMLGLNIISQNTWNSYVFVAFALLLFTLLCILKQQYNNEFIKLKYKSVIRDCVANLEVYQNRRSLFLTSKSKSLEKNLLKSQADQQNLDEQSILPDQEQRKSNEKMASESINLDQQLKLSNVENNEERDKEQFFEKLNAFLTKTAEQTAHFVYQPIVTLRVLQLLSIAVVIMQNTYQSLLLVIWILITGFTLNLNVNIWTSVLLGIPSLVLNFVTYYYANFQGMSDTNNPYLFCQNTEICPKCGFFQTPVPYANVLLMDLCLFSFFLFLKQAHDEQQNQIKIQNRKKEGMTFMTNKEAETPSWLTISLAILLKTSYVISLIIVYYIGFLDVNLIQFILVLFLLIFLINDSTLSSVNIINPKTNQSVEYIVPFAFKYWVLFVSYVAMIIVVRYLFMLFYLQTETTAWILALIGIDSRARYEIVFWVLFYFVALQYDSYKTKIYLKYSNNIIETIMLKTKGKEEQIKSARILGLLQLLFMKSIIWISFAVNICFLLFTPYSIINMILLLIVGLFFIIYTFASITTIDYRFMTKCWYIYLNLLYLTFIVRYFFQLICLPSYSQIMSSPLRSLYDTLQNRFFAYGLYQYNTSQLRVEYLPDMITIFFGALSLNTYRFLSSSQREIDQEQKNQREQSESQLSIDSEAIGGEEKLLERKQKQEYKQIAKLMQMKILEDDGWLRKTLVLMAQISTDILTLYVVVMVVFYDQSIAAFILMIMYLSYFLTVHNSLLDKMKESSLLQKMSQKTSQLQNNYISQMDPQKTQEDAQFEQVELEKLVKDIYLQRLKIRIDKKVSLWRYSFTFSCFCVFVTYASQILSLMQMDDAYYGMHEVNIEKAAIGLFVFGTYAQETYGQGQCFCGANDLARECSSAEPTYSSTIGHMVVFFLVLAFANVLDAGSTILLKDELHRKECELQKSEEERIKEKQLKREKELVMSKQRLSVIKEEDENDKSQFAASELQEAPSSEKEEDRALQTFLKRFPFFEYQIIETYKDPQELKVEEQLNIRKQALTIHYYQNKQRSFKLDMMQGGFIFIQRFFVFVLLCNVILVNNIFSLVYLAMAVYLFRSRTDVSNIKLLNTFSVIAIWVQYILLNILNYEPSEQIIPQGFDLEPKDFSLINKLKFFSTTDALDGYQSYLGFSNGQIMDCNKLDMSDALFGPQFCLTNSNLEWVFVMNTFVLIMIYFYFLLVSYMAKMILATQLVIEQDLKFTQEVLGYLRSNHLIEIKLNYQLWKNRLFTILQAVSNCFFRLSHILTAGFVILLAQSNRVFLNYVELFMGIVFLAIFEFFLPWTQRQLNLVREKKYFTVLFYIPTISVALFTILKFPYILNQCANQEKSVNQETGEVTAKANNFQIFFCLEIFDNQIAGMVFCIWFVTLHFDLISSQSFELFLMKFADQATQRAKMVSLALAYHKNFQKYRQILNVAEQKEVFSMIQAKAQAKLEIWHSKLLDKQEQNQQIEKTDDLLPTLAKQNSQAQKEKQLTEKQIETMSMSTTQKTCIFLIKNFQKVNDIYKFMGLPNIMDFLLSQNMILNRRVQLSIKEFMKEDFEKFNVELMYINNYLQKVFQAIAKFKNAPINLDSLQQEPKGQQTITGSMVRSQVQWKKMQSLLSKKKVVNQFLAAQKANIMDSEGPANFILNYDQYLKSEELCFVNIIDSETNIKVVKTKHASSLQQQTTLILVSNVLIELLHVLISYWMEVCYLMIIFYYIKDSGLIGGFLPLILFLWVLIDERATNKIFWLISYITFVLITLFIFGYSLVGIGYIEYLNVMNNYSSKSYATLWYYPLYDANQGIVFEGFILMFIIIQINLSKAQGRFEQSISDVENIFQGYVRMKLNKLHIYIRKEIRKVLRTDQQIDEEAEEGGEGEEPNQVNQLLKTQTLMKQTSMQQETLRSNYEGPPQLNTFQLEAKNNVEKRILQDPNLLFKQYSFWDRIFSYKFSRPGIDLYPITAGLQVLILIYTLIFFTSMTESGYKINNILKTNQIPTGLIWALLIEIILMVFERYVTLIDTLQVNSEEDSTKPQKQKFFEKYKLQYVLKFGLQLITVTLVYWFVFYFIGKPWKQSTQIESMSQSEVTNSTTFYIFNGYAITFFLLYCAYFTLSALQLRFGYQQLKMRNTILRSYNQFNYYLAQTYYSIPFLFELKVLMDWTFLETSLDVFQWFRLEDIHGIMYFTKNQARNYLKRPLGLKVPKIMKCGMGCSLVFFILVCIFGPLILFSTLNPSSQLNLVNGGQFILSILNVQTGLNVVLYATNQFYGLENPPLDSQDAINAALNQTCTNQVINDAPKSGALQEFQLISYSNTNWDISQPLYDQLTQQLNQAIQNIQTGDQNQSYFLINVTYTFTRQQEKTIPTKNQFSYPGNQGLVTYPGQNQTYLNITQLESLYKQLNCSNANENLSLFLPSFYVETLQLYSADGSSFKPRPIIGQGVQSVQNATLAFRCSNTETVPTIGPTWWNLNYSGMSPNLSPNAGGLILFVVSDTFSPLTYGFSIITIYTSVILLIGSFIRSLFSGQIWLLEYTGMVYPDDLIMICEAISIARSQKDFVKENSLYFELIDILRSPEIVKIMTGSWTKAMKKQQQLQLEEKAKKEQQQKQIQEIKDKKKKEE